MWKNWFSRKREDSQPEPRAEVAIRLEAIGGQGANTAGKILAEAAVLKAGFSGNHFSSFGSEKRGSPVKSFVRFSTVGRPIRTASSIERPDLLVIFHDQLLESHPEVLEGCSRATDLILSSEQPPERLRLPPGFNCRSLTTVPAARLATRAGCGLNAVLLGAISTVSYEVGAAAIRDVLAGFFAERGEDVRARNLKGFDLGVEQAASAVYLPDENPRAIAPQPLPEMGWMNAPIGGVIVNPGNSVLKDHSASRKGVAPKFTAELCFNCGFCDMVCPDFCFVWDLAKPGSAQLRGIDYQYCKGCQKCVSVCPVNALTPVKEGEIGPAERKVHAYPEVDRVEIEKRWKHMDWTAYLDRLNEEERMLSPETELLDLRSYLRPVFPADLASKKGKAE